VNGAGQRLAHELRQVGHRHVDVDIDAEPGVVVAFGVLRQVREQDALLRRADVDHLAPRGERTAVDVFVADRPVGVYLDDVDELLLVGVSEVHLDQRTGVLSPRRAEHGLFLCTCPSAMY